ncbi:MAG: GGDEF domain-containing protein [Pseudomonadota bacterium]
MNIFDNFKKKMVLFPDYFYVWSQTEEYDNETRLFLGNGFADTHCYRASSSACLSRGSDGGRGCHSPVGKHDRLRGSSTDCRAALAGVPQALNWVNDHYGHLAGDKVLEGVALILKKCTRLCDIVSRYGGEEFAVILPYTPYKNALKVAGRLRKTVENTNFDGITITISVGMGYFTGEDRDFDYKKIMELADKALYLAKNNGRNRVEVLTS